MCDIKARLKICVWAALNSSMKKEAYLFGAQQSQPPIYIWQ